MTWQKGGRIGFGILAAILALITVFLSFGMQNAKPIVLQGAPEAKAAVQSMLEDVSSCDAEKLSSHFTPGTDLTEFYQLNNSASQRLIQMVWENLDYEILSDAYADSGVLAVDVNISTLDSARLLDQAKALTAPMLNAAVDAAASTDDIMDEKNQYLDSFLQTVLLQAVDAALDFTPRREQLLTVHVQSRNGQWEILPEDSLINALSGWAK